MVAFRPFLSVLLQLASIFGKFSLIQHKYWLPVFNRLKWGPLCWLEGFFLLESSLKIKPILGCSSKTLLCNYSNNAAYLLVVGLISNSFWCRHVLAEAGVLEKSIRAVVVLAVEFICEALFEPIAIEYLWVVYVFVHFKIIINLSIELQIEITALFTALWWLIPLTCVRNATTGQSDCFQLWTLLKEGPHLSHHPFLLSVSDVEVLQDPSLLFF